MTPDLLFLYHLLGVDHVKVYLAGQCYLIRQLLLCKYLHMYGSTHYGIRAEYKEAFEQHVLIQSDNQFRYVSFLRLRGLLKHI